jgi:hypothetical protein
METELEKLKRELSEAKAKHITVVHQDCLSSHVFMGCSDYLNQIYTERDQWKQCAEGLAKTLNAAWTSTGLLHKDCEALAHFNQLSKGE